MRTRRALLGTAMAGSLPGLLLPAPGPAEASPPSSQPSSQPTSPPASRPAPAAPPPQAASPALLPREPLQFPRDHGAHPAQHTEWWYLTGELRPRQAPDEALGFQITFFRSRVDAAPGNPSRFAARQLVFAHTALSDPRRGQLLHDQRTARMGFGIVDASEADTDVKLRNWHLKRIAASGQGMYETHVVAREFTLSLRAAQTQPLLLQGEQGFSRKAPGEAWATRYYSQPQLAVTGQLRYRQQEMVVSGHAWLDHEWGERVLAPDAIGWDWIGMNLHDGSALMAFRTRRADGSVVWQSACLRTPGQPERHFAAAEIRLTPGRIWQSPLSNARYPVEWVLSLAGTRYGVRARMPHQELDSRWSTGNIYWEGLCDLLDAQGRVIGAGYLEMTGYASPMDL